MKTHSTQKTVVSSIIGALLFASITAIAGSNVDRSPNLYMERKQEAKTEFVQVGGSLTCEGEMKDAQSPCNIKLVTNNGAAYTLVDNSDAYRMFHSGQKNVEVTGKKYGINTIRISRIEAR